MYPFGEPGLKRCNSNSEGRSSESNQNEYWMIHLGERMNGGMIRLTDDMSIEVRQVVTRPRAGSGGGFTALLVTGSTEVILAVASFALTGAPSPGRLPRFRPQPL